MFSQTNFTAMRSKLSLPMLLLVLVGWVFQACQPEEEPEPACDGSLTVEVSSVSDSPCGEDSGTITVAASGGAGGYLFQLEGGDFSTSTSFDALSPDTYTIVVKDANDCVAEVNTKVTSGIVLDDIRPIIEANCATSGCHDGTNNRPNFTQDATIKNRASDIKNRTGNMTMPPASTGDTLTSEQIQLIDCWASDGAPG